MIKYPSTPQFRDVVRTVRERHDYKGKDENGNVISYHSEPYPTLEFKGTVKLHGTNAAIVRYFDGVTEYQSRERVLSLQSDNSNFMLTMLNKSLDDLFNKFQFNESVAIYGEWCGSGIQKGVAINLLSKRFVIFAVKVDGVFVDLPHDLHDNEQDIYNILQFPTYTVNIDFNNPQLIQNELIRLTNEVEESCPVGKYFGVEGIGEGIVFRCTTNPYLMFKSKGEKHSSSKVKVLNSIDVDLLNTVNEFVTYAVTENRLEQGISYLNEMNLSLDRKNTGVFVGWIMSDIIKEETDVLVKNGISPKQIGSAVNKKAKEWFFKKIDSILMEH